MSTVAIKKTLVEGNWNTKKNQEEAAHAFAINCMSAMAVIAKQGDKAVLEYQDILHKHQLEHLKTLGVKTPLDLVKAKAEFETNVFGSKIEIEGDENRAQLIYKQCAIGNAMKKYGKTTPEREGKMEQYMQTCVQNFAKEWGFKGDLKM